MACKIKNELGLITIDEGVISNLAGNAAVESYGIVAMVSKRASDGISELLGRENLTRGVRVNVQEDGVSVDLFVNVEYGISISAVAKSAMEAVKYTIEEMTGIKVLGVNVTVEGIRI